MIQKARTYLKLAFVVLAVGFPVMLPVNSYAFITTPTTTTPATTTPVTSCSDTTQNAIATGVNAATNSTTSSCSSGTNTGITSTIESVAKQVTNDLSIIVGIVAVIMIIYGGFKYITSGGESGGVESAKKTLIMAIIGLLIVALAQVIVHFVLTESSNISTTVAGFIHF